MIVDTLGQARSLGWKIYLSCAQGPRDGMKSIRSCRFRTVLDMDTLVATKGPSFPSLMLADRLMCPACASRRVSVVFEPPPAAMRDLGGGRYG